MRRDCAHENPVVRVWQETLLRYQDEAIRDARFKLSERIGKLAEQKTVFAYLSAVYVFVDKTLIPIAIHNHRIRESAPITLEDECLVAKVAVTGKPYYAPNVHAPGEISYREISATTQSELVVPIHWDGELIGVINLESARIHGLDNALDVVQSVIPSMISDLLVLRSCYSQDEDWCPWNPSIHGWDLSKLISQLLQTAGLEFASTSAKLTVWYPDWDKEVLFAYATYGYDWSFVDGDALSLSDSQIGKALRSRSAGLSALDVAKFIKREKAKELGIDEAWMVPICLSPESIANANDLPIGAITCYFANNGQPVDAIIRNERDLAKAATTVCDAELLEIVCRDNAPCGGSVDRVPTNSANYYY